jgi:hypothetical protein
MNKIDKIPVTAKGLIEGNATSSYGGEADTQYRPTHLESILLNKLNEVIDVLNEIREVQKGDHDSEK